MKRSGLLKNILLKELQRKRLIEDQEGIRKKIILKDSFLQKIKTVGGIDQSFPTRDRIISAIVVCKFPSLKIIERKHSFMKTTFPYIPGFLAYREGPPIMKAFSKIENIPDILIFDGNGILHKSGVGIASHLGVLLDKPTIGVAKSLLCGNFKEIKKVGDYSSVIHKNKTIGFAYRSRRGCNPIFISPGHKISLKTSLKIIKKCLGKYKIPVPIRLAHTHANELKKSMLGDIEK